MTFAALAVITAMGLAFYGWGGLFRRAAKMPDGLWPVTVVLGVGCAVFAGGLLNLTGLAPALAAFGATGIGLAAWTLNRAWPLPRLESGAWVLIVPIAVILIFVIATQLPPTAFNTEDDFHKYFVHPMRMLATGSVAGSPLSGIGSETLGGTAFLNGFVVAVLPLPYINATDAVFGLFLCLASAAMLAGPRHRLIGALCAVVAFAIDPQYVNTSALYLGAAAMMAAVTLTAGEHEARSIPSAAALALLAAALITMKPTFLLFVVLQGVLTVAVIGWLTRDVPRTAKWAGTYAGLTLVFLAPWIALHAPHYLAGLHNTLPVPVPTLQKETVSIFDINSNNYRLRPIWYTAAALTAIGSAFAAAWLLRKAPDRSRLAHTVASAIVLAGSYLVLAVASPWLAGWYVSLRYFTPFAIALIPALLALSLPHLHDALKAPFRLPAVTAIALVPILLFATRLIDRVEQAADYGNVLAFTEQATAKEYLAHNDDTFNGGGRHRVQTLQEIVPPGEPLMAYIDAPFWLDFNRNPVTEIDNAGLATPWAVFPESGYVLMDYKTPGAFHAQKNETQIREFGAHEWIIEANAIRFLRFIKYAATNGSMLYNDDRSVVFQQTQPAN